MEKKLGINKDRGKMQFKKRLAQENYDEDFLDFLDHIDNVVVEEKTKINPLSSIDKKKKKLKVLDPVDDVDKAIDSNEKIDCLFFFKTSK